MRVLWLSLAVVALSCGGGDDDDRLPAAPDGGGASSTGGSKSKAGSSSDAGAEADPEPQGGASTGSGGQGGQGIIYETAGAPSFPEGVCDPSMMPGDDEPQAAGVTGIKLLAMTLDELSVAFVTGSGDTTALYVADRSAVAEAFAEQQVTLPADYEASSGASLSSDGTRLILVKQAHNGFGELTRAARGQAFGAEADETRFANVNTLSMTTTRSVGWPVVSSDGNNLYYVTYPGKALVVQSGAGAGGVFEYGTEIDEFTLGGVEGEYKLLSGISADERAIFFHDEATGHAMALFRQYANAPFYDPLDLGEREGVAPNENCSRLYSSLDGGLVLQPTQ